MVARVARTGTSVLEQRMTGRLVGATYSDPEARELVDGMGVASAFVVPMTAGLDVVGVMAFIRSKAGNEFEPDDVQLAATLASRAALAVQNALLYARQTTVAQVLQQAVLPEALPEIDGVHLCATYEPATGGAGVGGDFYDVFRLASGRVGLAVGDAAGHGLQAGALMGQLRNALRAYAVEGHGPGATLKALSDLFAALEPEAFATVFYAELDPESGDLVWASAGHPPPLLTFADAAPQYLDGEGGPPIGVSAHRPDDQHGRIPAGGGIVMYTDGLIERRHLSIDVGLDDLRVMVERFLVSATAAEPGLVDGVVQGMRHEAGFADDVCVLLAARDL
jgi:serine phosphatase RsbU (regulator of sigma subunit)